MDFLAILTNVDALIAPILLKGQNSAKIRKLSKPRPLKIRMAALVKTQNAKRSTASASKLGVFVAATVSVQTVSTVLKSKTSLTLAEMAGRIVPTHIIMMSKSIERT